LRRYTLTLVDIIYKIAASVPVEGGLPGGLTRTHLAFDLKAILCLMLELSWLKTFHRNLAILWRG
jgi:hypothetical protein